MTTVAVEQKENASLAEDTVTVRVADIAEIDSFLKIEGACFPPDMAFDGDDYKGFAAEKTAGKIKDYRFFVAELDKRSVGFVFLTCCDPKTALTEECHSPVAKNHQLEPLVSIIDSIAVLPEIRKKGVASKLMEKVYDFAREQGTSQIFALGWSRGGFPLIAGKFGFELLHVAHQFYDDGSDAIVYMKKFDLKQAS